MNIKCKSNCSWGWKSILKGRYMLSKGLCWRVRDGKDIDTWKDPWVPNINNFKLTPTSNVPPQVHKVA